MDPANDEVEYDYIITESLRGVRAIVNVAMNGSNAVTYIMGAPGENYYFHLFYIIENGEKTLACLDY